MILLQRHKDAPDHANWKPVASAEPTDAKEDAGEVRIRLSSGNPYHYELVISFDELEALEALGNRQWSGNQR